MKKFILAIIALGIAAAVVRPATAQTFTVLHEFLGQDGANPEAGLVRDGTGTLYGTTFAGGGASEGTVFKLDNSGRETVLLTFNNFNGSFPASSLVFDKAGNLYGTAAEGPGGAGVLFRVTKTGESETVHAFQGGQDSVAAVPQGGVVIDDLGNFYGATALGGLGFGALYEADAIGELRILHTFDGKDGADPQGPLVRDANGNLFGVTLAGGTRNRGTVFKLGRDGTLTVLHNFAGGKDGGSPQGGLFRDNAGNLFGGALVGGDLGKGTLFEITAAGVFHRLYSFTGGVDGAGPNGGLVRDASGNIYGTAQTGGANGLGTAFQLSPAHVLTVLHTFTGDRDGAFPLSGLLRDGGGNLYGTTVKNFLITLQDGNVFKITP